MGPCGVAGENQRAISRHSVRKGESADRGGQSPGTRSSGGREKRHLLGVEGGEGREKGHEDDVSAEVRETLSCRGRAKKTSSLGGGGKKGGKTWGSCTEQTTKGRGSEVWARKLPDQLPESQKIRSRMMRKHRRSKGRGKKSGCGSIVEPSHHKRIWRSTQTGRDH